MTSKGEPYHRVRYKQIIQEEVLLSYISKGGVTYGDVELMTPHERKLALDAMKEIIESQNKAIEEKVAATKNKPVKDPKSALTSGIR